ncbi:hypothetical protein Leryth_002497 [Lithospermum erythrorhizon]|nr:hypothetical protein Leryth_002497 [Lithospermum erythrorhizon]
MALYASFFISLFMFSTLKTNALSSNYYDKTCPNAEYAITKIARDATERKDSTVQLLGWCDASVLLSSKKNTAEKDGPANLSLHAFFVIDAAKKVIDLCPGAVSCWRPYWDVPKGRKDGRVSKASETSQLPSPTFNFDQLQHSFVQRGLSTDDLVALSGAHTLGFSHCSSFQNRIRNFNSTHDIDPTLHPSFAGVLRSVCDDKNKGKNAGMSMDPSSTVFDNTYYRLILQKQSLFQSDQALLTHPKTKSLVYKYASSKEAFYKAFANSMIKMSSITGGQEGGKLRCQANKSKMINLFKVKEKRKELAENANGRPPVKKQSAGELRLHKDISELNLPKTCGISFPNGKDDLMNFEVTIRPDEGYYMGGTFLFSFQISPIYPHEAPKVKCKTKVYHPNIDLEGNVCLNILREDWKPVLSINTIIYGLFHLFTEPNHEDPLNHDAAAVLRDNPKLFESNVRRAMAGGYVGQTFFPRCV